MWRLFVLKVTYCRYKLGYVEQTNFPVRPSGKCVVHTTHSVNQTSSKETFQKFVFRWRTSFSRKLWNPYGFIFYRRSFTWVTASLFRKVDQYFPPSLICFCSKWPTSRQMFIDMSLLVASLSQLDPKIYCRLLINYSNVSGSLVFPYIYSIILNNKSDYVVTVDIPLLWFLVIVW